VLLSDRAKHLSQIFDLANAFPGPSSATGEVATHAFGITTLLSGDHEDRLPEAYVPVIALWREKVLDIFVVWRDAG
jgi:hypothetical protein